jgi:hypothetical protein
MKDNKMVQSNNAFVKKEQAKMLKMMGDRPGAPKEMKKFDAFMSNNEMTSKESARKLCVTLEDAFPLK